MNSVCLLVGLVAFSVVMCANAQNLNDMDVETRDIPSAGLREKRQFVVQLPGVGIANGIIGNNKCFWAGTSPFCRPECGSGFDAITKDPKGDGKRCLTGMKKYCCPKGVTIG